MAAPKSQSECSKFPVALYILVALTTYSEAKWQKLDLKKYTTSNNLPQYYCLNVVMNLTCCVSKNNPLLISVCFYTSIFRHKV